MVDDAKLDATHARERREALDAFWQVVKRLPVYGRLVVALARDRRVPARARVFLAGGGMYLVSPVDLVPGIIPVAGQLDDVYIALMAVRQALRTSPDAVAEEHLTRFGLTSDTIDDDLATIRRLIRVGVRQGARWGWARLKGLRRRMANR